MDIHKKYQKNSMCVSKEVDGEHIIIPLRNDLFEVDYLYSLNETASFVWNRLDKRQSPENIIKALCQEYEVDYNTAYNDVLNIMNEISEFIETVKTQL